MPKPAFHPQIPQFPSLFPAAFTAARLLRFRIPPVYACAHGGDTLALGPHFTEAYLDPETLTSRAPTGGKGILPSQELRQFVQGGIIAAPGIADDQIQPSSIDLRLGDRAYRVRASFLPGRASTLLASAASNGMLQQEIDLSAPALLEPGAVYIIPLMETLALPADVYGLANPKSSTGRLDIFTRLITEHTAEDFERVPRGYRGKLYIEVVSQTFPILVEAGMKLNQLRLGRGRSSFAGDARLRQLDRGDLIVGPDEEGAQANIDRGLRFTVDLEGNASGIVAYQARRSTPPIDLSRINHYDPAEYWKPIYRNPKLQTILEPGEFYILVSKERVRVSPDFAAEMLPYDLGTQEFRVHYAGFFDPGFGYGAHGEIPGTRAVLEVRATQMPILLEDGQFVGRLNYYKMAAVPDKIYGVGIGSNYQQQGLTLSKHFKRAGQPASDAACAAASGAGVDLSANAAVIANFG